MALADDIGVKVIKAVRIYGNILYGSTGSINLVYPVKV